MLPLPLAAGIFPLFLVPAPPDEGYDLVVLDMPHRVVLGDTMKFAVRGRPGVPYSIFADVTRTRVLLNGTVFYHLGANPLLLIGGALTMPANGSAQHALPVPSIPALNGLTLFAQAFALDAGVIKGIASSDAKTVTLHREQNQPLIRLLTVNRIERDFNGSEKGEGMLTVPHVGFTVDVFFDDRGKAAIDPKSLEVTADIDLANGALKSGTNLAQFFTFKGSMASGLVTNAWAFPSNQTKVATLTVKIKNTAGTPAPVETYRFESTPLPSPGQRPFGTKHIWFLDFVAHDLDNSGVPDYREDLLLYGLGKDPRSSGGPSFEVSQWTQREIQKILRENYGVGQPGGVNLDFVLKKPAATHARICIGGRNRFSNSRLPPGANGTTGAAFLNPNNRNKSIVDCFGLVGVHTWSIYNIFKGVTAFQRVFGPLQRNPVGNDVDDLVVTRPGFDPKLGTVRQQQRYKEILLGVMSFARATSFVLTQETSHSMGLVRSGNLGPGSFMGAHNWGHSTFGHFDDGLGNFLSGNNSTPAPAQPANLAMIWDHFQSGRGHFTALAWGYLTETVIDR